MKLKVWRSIKASRKNEKDMKESGKTNKKIEGSSKNLVKNSANAEINEITHIRMECIEEKYIESPRSKKKSLKKER